MLPQPSRLVLSDSSIGLELRPHRSLERNGVRCFLLSVALAAFAGATLAAMNGAWPALIFAAIEVVAIAFALHLNMRAREDLHRIVIDERDIRIQITERGRTSDLVLPRYWCRVCLRPSRSRLHPCRLQLECQGKACELGSFLNEPDRAEVEKTLQLMIGPCGCAPSLSAAIEVLTRPALEKGT